ncbi:uncharacterized protein TEOVI_000381700 [Trypanosoma equiperdum]|uniref:Uncharacterized protein n=1 Tax=Trypanosoma equiperdum TaxID=5694 RepID=A0A1G4IIB6_TRYEQ|nr:hypothetical protein, conserved [Trypanosoma equiperdum]
MSPFEQQRPRSQKCGTARTSSNKGTNSQPSPALLASRPLANVIQHHLQQNLSRTPRPNVMETRVTPPFSVESTPGGRDVGSRRTDMRVRTGHAAVDSSSLAAAYAPYSGATLTSTLWENNARDETPGSPLHISRMRDPTRHCSEDEESRGNLDIMRVGYLGTCAHVAAELPNIHRNPDQPTAFVGKNAPVVTERNDLSVSGYSRSDSVVKKSPTKDKKTDKTPPKKDSTRIWWGFDSYRFGSESGCGSPEVVRQCLPNLTGVGSQASKEAPGPQTTVAPSNTTPAVELPNALRTTTANSTRTSKKVKYAPADQPSVDDRSVEEVQTSVNKRRTSLQRSKKTKSGPSQLEEDTAFLAPVAQTPSLNVKRLPSAKEKRKDVSSANPRMPPCTALHSSAFDETSQMLQHCGNSTTSSGRKKNIEENDIKTHGLDVLRMSTSVSGDFLSLCGSRSNSAVRQLFMLLNGEGDHESNDLSRTNSANGARKR